MKLDILKGTTSRIIEVFIQDSSSTVGAGLTGVAFGDITAYYALNGAAGGATVHTPATMTIGTWASGGFVEKDATNMPGVYQLGVFDAALTGADSVIIMLKGATNMAPVVLEIQLTDYDPYDAVRMGMTSLPNAVVDGAGGLVTSAGGATGIDDLATPTNITAGTIATVTDLTNLPSIPANWLTAAGINASALDGKGDWNVGKTGYALSGIGADLILKSSTFALAMADAIWDELLAGHVTADSAGLLLNDWQDGGRLDLILDIIAADVVNIDGAAMRGTDSAALASVLGALTDAAVDGDPTSTDTVMQYIKQLVNVLVGTAGVVAYPTAAAPGNGVNLAEVLRSIYDDTNSLDGTKIPDTISLAAINAEVDTALDTAISELGVGLPTATPTVRTGIMLGYMALRNQLIVQTSGTDALEIYNDAGTKIASKALTDDGSDYTEAKMISG